MTTPHIDDNGKHIDDLEFRLRDLRSQFTSLGQLDDVDDLLTVVRWPGWTTLAHLNLINALVDAAERSTDDLRRIRAALVEGARLIGEEAQEATV